MLNSLDGADLWRQIYFHLLAQVEWTSYCWLLTKLTLTLLGALQGEVKPLGIYDQ